MAETIIVELVQPEVIQVELNPPPVINVSTNNPPVIQVTVAGMGVPGNAGVKITVSETEPVNPQINEIWIQI